jgi:hypothetical protein
MEKAYTQKNTHLQTAQSQSKSQSLKESIFYPNPRQIKKNLPLLKETKLIRLTNKDIRTSKKKHLAVTGVWQKSGFSG